MNNRFGAHVSIAGGVGNAPVNAAVPAPSALPGKAGANSLPMRSVSASSFAANASGKKSTGRSAISRSSR